GIGSVVGVLRTGLYTVLGGMRAVAYTGALQTFILIAGSGLLTMFGLSRLGGWHELRRVLDPDLFNLWKPLVPAGMEGTWAPVKEPGRIAWYFNSNYPWLGMLFCAPIIGLWYWCTDQYIVQRVLGARDERTARRGSIFAAYLKLSPVLLFIIPGLIALALAKTGRAPGLSVMVDAQGNAIPQAAQAIRLCGGGSGVSRPADFHGVRVRHLQQAPELQGVPRRVARWVCAGRVPVGRGHARQPASGGIRQRLRTELVPVDRQQSLF